MKIKKGFALLISLALMIGTVLPGTLALSADEASGSGTVEVSAETLAPAPDAEEAPALEETAAPASEETVAPASEETAAPDETPTKEPDQTCTCDPAPAEGEAHKEGCPLYTAPKQPAEEGKTCTCDPAPAEGEAHQEGCPLYVAPKQPAEEGKTCTCDPAPAEGEAHKEGCPLYEAPECTCGAAEGELHKEDCPLYTAPEAEDYTDLFNRFLEAQTYEEFDAIYQELTEEERTAFAAWLTENDKMEALQAHFSQLYIVDEPQEEEPIVPFTNVGPLLAAPVARPRMLRAPSKAGDNSGIVLNKTAAVNSDGSYTITLEAYATGETTTTVTHQPVDIVLVLDVSGSMKDTFGRTKVYDDGSLDKNKTYYVSDYYGGYTAVTWNKDKNSWGYWDRGLLVGTYWYDFTPKTSSSDSRHTQFYNTTKKIDALKTAVNGFIDSVAGQSPDSNIAIVKFAGDKIDRVGNDTYRKDGYQYNNSQIVTDLTAAGTGANGLKNAVNALNPAGATAADYGMQHAQSIISGAADDGKKKVVIMFTDGEPNHRNGFNTSVANAAINASKGIKDNGATVYTIGVFSGANGAPVTSLSGVDNTNKYMHLVSSNYKNATSMSNTGDSTYPGGGKSYFLSASNAGELSAIFQSISQEVGGATTTLDETATIKDIVSPYFTMPADAQNVTVKTAESNGSTESWKDAAAFNGTVSIDNASSAVSVSGFSFKDNWCGNQKDANGSTTFHNGKKLIIEFKVSRKEGFLGGNDVPTNGENSGIYDKDGTEVKKFDVPTVNVPIEDVTVNAYDKNVYLLGNVTADQLKSGAEVSVGNVELNLSKADQNYGLEDWQTEYVNITVAVKGEDGKEISADSLKNLTEDTTYTVEVAVAPTTEATSTDKKGPAATEQSNTANANINVFKPELTFKDSTAYYGADVPEYTGNLTTTEWKHGDTTDTSVFMTGDQPSLDITYTPEAGKIEDNKINTKQDIGVDATVKIQNTDITDKTKFKHTNCSDQTCTLPEGKKFLIHVKTCTLEIKKTGGAADESYVFDVLKDGTKYSEVTVWGNGTETLVELPVGTYTISEDTGWSWRYSADNGGSAELSAEKHDGSITCNNTKNKDHWLNGFSTVVQNIYGNNG